MKEQDISVKDLQAGNETAVRQLFDCLHPSLCLFATQYLKDDNEAADVAQECFLTYWMHHQEFDDLSRIRSYLYASVRNKCLNRLRHDRYRNRYLEETEKDRFYQENLLEEESIRIFYQAVDKLPPQSRRVIRLAAEGNKNQEIAEKMNISVNTVHMLKKIAYKKLKGLLKDYYYLIFVFLG